MYHLELRKFPHVVCRFNQSEAQLRALVVPWMRQEWIEEGERKWNANEATLTILEGPKLSMPELAMGKGWRNAQKRSQDVTERVLGAVRKGESREQAGTRGGGEEARDLELLADSLALEVLALLDEEPVAPSRVWLMAQERLVERGGAASAAEALALAERAVGSLLRRGLVVLRSGAQDAEPLASRPQELSLASVETWAGGGSGQALIARKS